MKQSTDEETISERRQHSRSWSLYHKLAEACKRHELAQIKAILLERPELVNQRDRRNRSLLHYASILLRNEPAADEAQRAQEGARSVHCFDHLTERCDLKLWWQQDLDGLSCLHLAVISGNEPLTRHLLFEHPYASKYPLACALDNELHSPLHWAVITNNLSCAKLLVDCAGVRLALEPDLNGASPLHYATQTGECPRYRQQLQLMLKNVSSSSCSESQESSSRGGSLQSRTRLARRQQLQRSADQSSCSTDGAELTSHQLGLELLDYLASLADINLECQDKDKRTPLLWAASSGNRQAVKLLAERGANLASSDSAGLSALHCAASHGYTDCIECLLACGQPAGQLQVNQPDKLNCTALFYAVLSGNIDCVESLLERGADQNWQDLKGRSAAHFAALKGQLNSLKLLLARGANLWLANKQGDLPLHYAIKSGRQQVVRWLLEQSPYERPVNAINNSGRAPIHLALLKGNAPLADYLIRCGANLDQLVKVRHSTGYQYETALDMAERLGHLDCLALLRDQKARSAGEVMRQRALGRPSAALFGLQAAQGPSPIGFETSSSSASFSNAHELKGARPAAQVPRMSPPPAPDALPHSDSAGSSALSQNSLTSLRDGGQGGGPAKADNSDEEEEEEKPYESGISYNNELIKASIRCKLYGHNRSFPAAAAATNSSKPARSAQSAPSGTQEIITNVNVFTQSPCPRCMRPPAAGRARQQSRCDQCASDSPARPTGGRGAWRDETESDTESESRQWAPAERLPSVQLGEPTRRPPAQQRYLPPSQSHEQQLPAIFSDDQQRSGSASSEEQSVEQSESRPDEQKPQQRRSQSRADEEPRFDWSERAGSRRRPARCRQQVRSPVADYIHSGEPHLRQQQQQHQGRSVSLNRLAGEGGPPDLSQVRAKVDSRRARGESVRSTTSMSMLSQVSSKSPTREELAQKVERSIRKYKQESKLFEELQNLKRSQIRSGRANEALLVKRLVERFRQDHTMLDLLGLAAYTGPFTYKSYELYLYEQLRKLSQSNCAKLSQLAEPEPAPVSPQLQDEQQYLEEDLRAEQELRRVTMGVEDEQNADLEEIQLEESEQDGSQVAAELEAESSELSRAQVVAELHEEVESSELEQQEKAEPATGIEDELTSAILVDALGNVSRASSADEAALTRQVSVESLAGEAKLIAGRRKSVVTIGNKVEMIFHDVGIEVESPAESPAQSPEPESDLVADLPAEARASDQVDAEQQASETETPAADETELTEPEDSLDTVRSRKDSLVVAPSQVRRSSSPPASSSIPMLSDQRRSSSEDQAAGKKVFNGHDLDQMRRSLRRSPALPNPSGGVARGPEEPSRRSSEIGGFVREAAAAATSKVERPSAAARRRLMVRSRIPEGAFRPHVELGVVRARWAELKATGRRRRHLERPQSVGLGRFAGAKSQPNLSDETQSAGEAQNYELLYELNKSLLPAGQAREQAGREKSAGRQVKVWCHRRMVRIVDARALKRTLSLPESLIYSNDLLKRFNILKL